MLSVRVVIPSLDIHLATIIATRETLIHQLVVGEPIFGDDLSGGVVMIDCLAILLVVEGRGILIPKRLIINLLKVGSKDKGLVRGSID